MNTRDALAQLASHDLLTAILGIDAVCVAVSTLDSIHPMREQAVDTRRALNAEAKRRGLPGCFDRDGGVAEGYSKLFDVAEPIARKLREV